MEVFRVTFTASGKADSMFVWGDETPDAAHLVALLCTRGSRLFVETQQRKEDDDEKANNKHNCLGEWGMMMMCRFNKILVQLLGFVCF